MITKTANDTMEDLNWSDSMTASARAMRRGNSGVGQFIADDELVGKRLRKQLGGFATYGSGGAGLGALVGASMGRGGALPGAIIGGVGAGLIGQMKGHYDADKEFLQSRGMDFQRFPANLLGMVRATPEARRKYLGVE